MSKVKIEDLRPNPFRRRNQKDKQKVERLKTSIHENTFWDNFVARPSPKGDGTFEIAHGHQRLFALRELLKEGKIPDKVNIPIRELSNIEMMRYMIEENLECWNTRPYQIIETIADALELINKELARHETLAEYQKSLCANIDETPTP